MRDVWKEEMKISEKIKWVNRIVGHDEVDPQQLLSHPENWRIHPQYQQEALRGVISDIGFIKSVTVNKRSGRVVDGHLRVTLALRDNVPTIPVEYVDLTDAEEAEALLTIDPLAALAGSDKDNLTALLARVDTNDAAVLKLLEDTATDAGIMRGEPEDAESQIDRAAELQKQWGTELGQLWTMAGHRLLIGDCTVRENVERLMGGERAEIMVTDPPYGIEYDPTWRIDAGLVKKETKKMGKVENDDIADWTPAWELFSGDVAYVYHAGIMSGVVQKSLENCGFKIRQQIIWNKDRMALSRGDYHWKHEPCWYAVREGKPSNRTDDRKQVTVWDIPSREDSGHGHGTQKPIECMARPIRNHNFKIVYEPFAGSGTTIIAAHNLNRRCFAMELSPAYGAVILQRFQDATGITPVLSSP